MAVERKKPEVGTPLSCRNLTILKQKSASLGESKMRGIKHFSSIASLTSSALNGFKPVSLVSEKTSFGSAESSNKFSNSPSKHLESD